MSLSKEQYQEIVRVLQENVDKLSHHDPITIQAVYPDRYEKILTIFKERLKMMSNYTGTKVNSTKQEREALSQASAYLLDMLEDLEKEIKQ